MEKVSVDSTIKGLEFIKELDGLQLLGIFFILFLIVGISIFFILLKKGHIKLNSKQEIKESDKLKEEQENKDPDEFKPTSRDPNVIYFESRRWEKDRILKRHLGWIKDAYPKGATLEDKEKLEKAIRYAELESIVYTDYIIARNQFGKMSEREFDDYQEKIPLDIIMHVSRNITSIYDKMDFTISRDAMLEETKKLIPKCVKDLAQMFMSFRMMEIEDEEKTENQRSS